jgi:hypothetical protein
MAKMTVTAILAVFLVLMISSSSALFKKTTHGKAKKQVSRSFKSKLHGKKVKALKATRMKTQDHEDEDFFDPSGICNTGNFLGSNTVVKYCYVEYTTKSDALDNCPKDDDRITLDFEYTDDGNVLYYCSRAMEASESGLDCTQSLGSSAEIWEEKCEDLGYMMEGPNMFPCEEKLHEPLMDFGACCSSQDHACFEYDISQTDMCNNQNSFEPENTLSKTCIIGPRNHVFTHEECPYVRYYQNDDDCDGLCEAFTGYYCISDIHNEQELQTCYDLAKSFDEDLRVMVETDTCASAAYEFTQMSEMDFCSDSRSSSLSRCCNDEATVCGNGPDSYYYNYGGGGGGGGNDRFFDVFDQQILFSPDEVCCATSNGEGFTASTTCTIFSNSLSFDSTQCPEGWTFDTDSSDGEIYKQCVMSKPAQDVNTCSNEGTMTTLQFCGIAEDDIPMDATLLLSCYASNNEGQCPEGDAWETHDGMCYKTRMYYAGVLPPNMHCQAGKVSSNDMGCEYCKAGTIPLHNRNKCIPCKAGTFSPGFMDSCIECQAGMYSLAGSSSCHMCPVGTYSWAGSSVCHQCDEGKTSAPGSASCHTCYSGQAV